MAAVMADDDPGFGLLAVRLLTESGFTVVETPVTGTRQSPCRISARTGVSAVLVGRDRRAGAVAGGTVAGLARACLDWSAVADLVVEFGAPLPPGHMQGARASALHDPLIEVGWLPEREVFVAESGVTVEASTEDGGRALRMLARDGELIAAVIRDPRLVDQPGLVSAVAAVAGLAIENECLHTQARAHLIQPKASRAGTVAAAGTERRRLEGNLHDGAQQPMLNLMLGLRLATVTVGANSDNGEQPAIRNSERGTDVSHRSESENPVIPAPSAKTTRPKSNRDWWPNQPDLGFSKPRQGAPVALAGQAEVRQQDLLGRSDHLRRQLRL
jgi:hypothetical protein